MEESYFGYSSQEAQRDESWEGNMSSIVAGDTRYTWRNTLSGHNPNVLPVWARFYLFFLFFIWFIYLSIYLFTYLFLYQDSNSGPCTCQVGIVPLSYIPGTESQLLTAYLATVSQSIKSISKDSSMNACVSWDISRYKL